MNLLKTINYGYNMAKTRVGHKENSFLNGEWAGHVRRFDKKWTAKIRRNVDKKVIKQETKEL